jgi:hypothetical protein
VVIIGNHWDAWIIGGAADPNSGSAVMIELAKAFGKLQKSGWQPKRTMLVFEEGPKLLYTLLINAHSVLWLLGMEKSTVSLDLLSGLRNTYAQPCLFPNFF